ncbi:MAG: hypothetical protein JWQ79_558 [Mucilaginibacter sp.]|jgi:hypothetical protein|nr:hypothetical protein [Mucilaginibacter sp.]
MKKLFITAAIATMFSVTAFADGGKKAATTASSEKYVTYTALNQFKSDFRSADNVLWTVTANCQKVSFTDNNIDYTAFYSLSGDYLGVTENVDYKTLTAVVKTKIAESYKGYTVKSVIKFTTQSTDEPVVYFVDVATATSDVVLKVTPFDTVSFFKQVK